jgi:membrane-bound lytic murein transglycosylase F
MIQTWLLVGLAILAAFGGCTQYTGEIAKKQQETNDTPYVVGIEGNRVDLDGLDNALDPATVGILKSYGPTIKKYSEKYGFDWRLVLAVMKQESRFRVEAESEKGASGLMQIMPVTSVEVASHLKLDDLTHPVNNIRGGIFYLRKLHNLFEGAEPTDRIKLTLAAYNAGMGRIYDAQELAAYLQENPHKWEAVRDALPLLSKRYYTLHRNVWNEDKPRRAGWFGNSSQTVVYVDKIMTYYDEYRLVLN